MREPKALKVIRAAGVGLPVIKDLVEVVADFLRDEVEGVDALHLHFDNDAQRAHGDSDKAQQLRVLVKGVVAALAGGIDKRQRCDGAGESGKAQAGAVRGGRHRAGERLRVHVALVGERQPEGCKQPRHSAQACAGEEAHALAVRIDADDAAELVQVDHRLRARGDGRKGMPSAHRAYRAPCGAHEVLHLRDGRWLEEGMRLRAHGAGPVRKDHRNVHPLPR